MAPNTSNDGKRVTTQQYTHEIARGRVPGASVFGGYGKLEAAGAVTKNVIWPNGAFNFPDQVTGEDISFVSTSAQDAVGGDGISKVEIHYLDVDLNPQSVGITLTGATPVTGQLSGVRFIQCMHIKEVGVDLAAAGLIEAYRAGTEAAPIVFSLISVGDERCLSSLRMVPNGKTAFFQGAVGSAISGTAAARVVIELVATELDDHQYINPFILIPYTSVGVQDNGEAFVPPGPLVFKTGTVIGFRATSDKGATISANWFGWLEPTGA